MREVSGWPQIEIKRVSRRETYVLPWAASRLSMPRRGMTAKNRERLRSFDDPANVVAFLGLPRRIRQELEKSKAAPISKAVLAQTAAAIALLQAAPIRVQNLTNLDIRNNLIARGKRLYLVIPGEDVKNGERRAADSRRACDDVSDRALCRPV